MPTQPTTIGGLLRRRRLQLGHTQAQTAQHIGVSTVTLSRWECDKVYPTWPQQPAVAVYLGKDPFIDPTLGAPKSNETPDVAMSTEVSQKNIGRLVVEYCDRLRKTRKQFAKELGIDAKTIRNWETGRRRPLPHLQQKVLRALSRDFSEPHRADARDI